MQGDSAGDPTVLVVEDERRLAELYAEYLADDYRVVTATSGAEGLDRVDDTVDVALVDRRLTDTSGHEFVAAIEARDVDCRVALVLNETPDFDVIGLRVDDFLVKPVTRDEARRVVDRLVTITEYTRALERLTRKKLTRNVLRVERSRDALERSDRYRRLQEEITQLQRTVDELAADLDVEDRPLVL